MDIKPISPSEIESSGGYIKTEIPDFVFEAVNRLLHKNANYRGNKFFVRLTLNEIKEEIEDNGHIVKSSDLDFEYHYEKAGWVVEYVKPPYYECTPSYFTFLQK